MEDRILDVQEPDSLVEETAIAKPEDRPLTKQEAFFCMYYVNAPAPIARSPRACYQRAFGVSDPVDAQFKGRELLQDPAIKKRLKSCAKESELSAGELRSRVINNLLAIAEECSTPTKDGKINPSARSVAVTALKAVAEYSGIKDENARDIGSSTPTGVTFNFVMPKKDEAREANA